MSVAILAQAIHKVMAGLPAVHKSKQGRSQCADEVALLLFCVTFITDAHEFAYPEQFEAPVEQERLVENAAMINALLEMAAPVQLHLANALKKHAASMEKTWHIVGPFAEQWAETTARKLRTMRRHASQAVLKINKKKAHARVATLLHGHRRCNSFGISGTSSGISRTTREAAGTVIQPDAE